MKISRLRFIVQVLAFLFLIYGFYAGLRLPTFTPAMVCTNPSNYSANCYLLPLQRFQFNYSVFPQGERSLPFPAFIIMWGGLKSLLSFILPIIIFIIVFNKMWCGWLCPFGTFQDGVSYLRKITKLHDIKFSDRVKSIFKPWKYVSLLLLLIVPIMYGFGYKAVFPFFCRICPARVFLTPFEGNFTNLGIGFPPGILESILTCVLAGILIVLMFFRTRFFCIFCPISGLYNIFAKFSISRLKKDAKTCISCAKCWKACPMDVKEVYLEDKKNSITSDDCIFCFKCIENCPGNKTLSIKFLNRNIFSSGRYFLKYLKAKLKRN